MTDNNPRQDNRNQRDPQNDALGHEFDAALAKFTAVEPRTGLEDRILANLRAEKEHAADRSRWRWPALAALAAVIVVTVFVTWRPEKPAQNLVEHRPSPATQTNGQDRTQVANHGGSGSIRPHETVSPRKLKPHAAFHPGAAVARAPKLDQFPSPQPLSEQERMLTEYVAEHHQQAVLVARARMVELKKDLAEEMEEASATSNRQTSEQSVSRQEDR